ncbi:MAG: KAP family NTPase [Comamonadaceae bacterium]|nr:KAP family NTPase [Comamonadaceae bacterium]
MRALQPRRQRATHRSKNTREKTDVARHRSQGRPVELSLVAKAAAELIRESGGAPITIGVSGGWGVGKSLAREDGRSRTGE